jgi:hypothetical protein
MSSMIAVACDEVQSAPKIIVADGQTYLACKDSVWVDSDGGFRGGTTFKISFTDAAGARSHDARDQDAGGKRHAEVGRCTDAD